MGHPTHRCLGGDSFYRLSTGDPCAGSSSRASRSSSVRRKRERSRAADEANRRENEANRERNRTAEARERQRKNFERLDQAALLSARVQLEPSETNRDRLRDFLTLMVQRLLDDGDIGEGLRESVAIRLRRHQGKSQRPKSKDKQPTAEIQKPG